MKNGKIKIRKNAVQKWKMWKRENTKINSENEEIRVQKIENDKTNNWQKYKMQKRKNSQKEI